ncbi:MAG: ABC transporter ATP-binding protein/permease [Oscillospiraceae bacterium]|nr:ABC transporter ATP-binding protein/permease [Oscillospiraceae bacterium]
MFQLKWMWKQMGWKRVFWVCALLCSALTSTVSFINPMLSRTLIDEIVLPGDFSRLIPTLASMLGIQMFILSLRYTMLMFNEISSQEFVGRVRRRVYHVLQHQDHFFYAKIRTGDLMTRVTGDLDASRHLLGWVYYNLTDCVVTFAASVGYLCTVNLKLTLFLLPVAPLILIISVTYSRISRKLYRVLRQKLSSLNTVVQENIEGNRVVKAFAREPFEQEKFEEKNEEFRRHNLHINMMWMRFWPFLETLAQTLTVITVLAGGLLMIHGEMTPGDLLAFTSLTWAIANPLRNIGNVLNDFQRCSASASMVIELFYSEPTVADKPDAKPIPRPVRGDVEFINVSLNLNDTMIIDDVSFKAKAGSTLGIMGPTGSGKTSLLSLLDRFYDPTGGRILLDGVDISEATIGSVRSAIGIAMQEVFLFSDTVDGNIAYGSPDLPFEDVKGFAAAAKADGFIKRMPEGYDTIVGERGVGLSGGQRQRISLARALAVRPAVLILDDTTSALDMETEHYIQKQLRHLDFECTKIIVAQRTSSLQDADNIIVLEDGHISEHGTHEELLAKKGYYYGIWLLQNGR